MISNDRLPKLMDIDEIEKKHKLCFICERHINALGKPTYSDDWIKQGYTCGQRFKVSDIVDYRIWSDNAGDVAGVTVNFETANSFHYELLSVDWNKFILGILCIKISLDQKQTCLRLKRR